MHAHGRPQDSSGPLRLRAAQRPRGRYVHLAVVWGVYYTAYVGAGLAPSPGVGQVPYAAEISRHQAAPGEVPERPIGPVSKDYTPPYLPTPKTQETPCFSGFFHFQAFRQNVPKRAEMTPSGSNYYRLQRPRRRLQRGHGGRCRAWSRARADYCSCVPHLTTKYPSSIGGDLDGGHLSAPGAGRTRQRRSS